MTEVAMLPLPVRERSNAQLHLQAVDLRTVVGIGVQPVEYQHFSLPAYTTIRGMPVEEEQAPLSLRMALEVGDVPAVKLPWLPRDYRPSSPLLGRWVADDAHVSSTADGVRTWAPLVGSGIWRAENARHLHSYGLSVPEYTYRTPSGRTAVEAVELASLGSLRLRVDSRPCAEGLSLMALIATLPRYSDSYDMLTMTTSRGALAARVTGGGMRLTLRLGDEELCSMLRFKPSGNLAAVVLGMLGDYAYMLWAVAADSRIIVRTAATRVLGMEGDAITSLGVGSGQETDTEAVELLQVQTGDGDPRSPAVALANEMLGYYRDRSL